MDIYAHYRCVTLRNFTVPELDEVMRVTEELYLTARAHRYYSCVVVLDMHWTASSFTDLDLVCRRLVEFIDEAASAGVVFKGHHVAGSIHPQSMLIGMACAVSVASPKAVFKLPLYGVSRGHDVEYCLRQLKSRAPRLPTEGWVKANEVPELDAVTAQSYGLVSHLSNSFAETMEMLASRV